MLIMVIAAVLLCGSQLSLGQLTPEVCVPQVMVQVPVTVQIRHVSSSLNLCSASKQLSEDFAALIEPKIGENYKPPVLQKDCQFMSLNQVEESCTFHGRHRRRVIVNYRAMLTCNDGCTKHRSDRESLRVYKNQENTLRTAMRTKTEVTLDESINGTTVSIFYFRGKKGSVTTSCRRGLTFGSINKNIDLCICPRNCPSVCSLGPETGLCRAFFPRYFHNSTTRQCERFIYGGCGGNQNNFETIEDCQRECKVCTDGKVFQSCGTACPKTCANKDEVFGCTLQCVEDCFCPEGTVELGDQCVAPEDCPSDGTDQDECPAGKVFQDCGTACPRTCTNKDENVICTAQCVQGCFCPDGMVELDDKCVAPEDCPVEEPECPAGKVFNECGTACPRNCTNKDENVGCIARCVEGCFCPDGMVELGDKCVAPEDCPVEEPKCPAGKVFNECGSACPRNCTNKDELQICTAQCVQGCFCPDETVELGDGCVAPENCPVVQNCPLGKVFQECGTACPLTCTNKDQAPLFCTLQCVQGCFCTSGTVELNDGCVAPEDCPAV